jgi:hypothetical protein
MMMQNFSLGLSEDGTTLSIAIDSGAAPAQLTAEAVDELIRELATMRARMTPIHPAEPAATPDSTYTGDNLLWCIRASPHIAAVELCIQHPGLGWIAMPLSRAQIEDLETSIAFTLQDLRAARLDPQIG